MVKREKANYMIQSVSHAIDVLEELAKAVGEKAGGEIGVTELSKRLKLHKNNVFRLLATLQLRGFVEQNAETEDYCLGVKTLELGQAYWVQDSIGSRVRPLLKKLSEDIGETVSFAVLQCGAVHYPVTIESRRPVKVAARVATSFSAKQCASGRLLTAQLPDTMLAEILAGNTPQDAAIKSQLGELRSSGQLVDRGGIEADVVTISKTVECGGSEVAGAIEVLIPQYRAKIENVMPQITEVAEELSKLLGATRRTSLAAGIEKEVINESTDSTTGTQIPTSSELMGQAKS